MKKYCLITTYYGININSPSITDTKTRFKYDGPEEDLYINFDNTFDPWNKDHLRVGESSRKDLIYGKIFLLKDFIRDNILNKYEFTCHIDYSDTKFSKSFLEMMLKFNSSGKDFIIATEKTCWPYLDTVKSWTNKNVNRKEFEYINSGCIIAKSNILYTYLEKLANLCLTTNINFWDDQGVWQYYDYVVESLPKDSMCDYFFCTALLDSSYFTIDSHIIKTKFNTSPYIIHDNSSFSLNLINKI